MIENNIIPPPELVREWYLDATGPLYESEIANRAAQWGADQELEACCEVLARELICDGKHVATDLRMIRRPKPPSLKEQLLQKLDHISDVADKYQDTQDAINDLRRALEQLND